MLPSMTGCGVPPAERGQGSADEADGLDLRAGAELHSVTLGGRGSEEHAVPTRIVIEPGDAVEFRTVDRRVHTVRFPEDSLDLDGRRFLESTGQMASPPLVDRGGRFIVRFDDAPRGRYPFESRGHGGTAWGVVEVGPLEVDSTDAGGAG